MYVLDLRQPPQRPVLLGRHATGPVHDVAGSVDGRWAVSFDLRQLCVWNVASGGLQWQRDDANCFTLDPQSPRVLSATTAGELIDLDLETGGATALPGPAFAHIRGLAISPDGQLLAVVHDLSGVAVLNRQTAEMLWQVESGMYAGAPNLVFSPSGRLLVSLAQDDLRPLAVWDARTGGRPGHLSGHSICVLGAAFGPDGALYSWGPDGMIRTWDPHTCTPLAVTPLTPPPHAR